VNASIDAIAAVDPGREKCGIAVLSRDGVVLMREVVAAAELAGRVQDARRAYGIRTVILGSGTGHATIKSELMSLLAAETVEILEVPEFETTLAARKLYFQRNPPRGWRRLLPQGLRLPPEPIDGYAAEAIGRRYLGLDSPEQ
jgi:RNase H-fold protein (predicted Holliday junction resolvase)